MCCSLLAPIRFVPFSYFWTCWNVRPSALPSFSWLMFSINRRIRTRLPTCLSTGFGDFFMLCPHASQSSDDANCEDSQSSQRLTRTGVNSIRGVPIDSYLFIRQFLYADLSESTTTLIP